MPGPLRPPVAFRHPTESAFAPDEAITSDQHPAISRRATLPRRRSALPGLGVAALVVAAGLYIYGDVSGGHDTLIGLILIPIFVALLTPFLTRLRARESRFDLAGLVLLSFGLKMVASYFRLINAVDAREYNREGARLAESFRQLDFFVDTGREIPGTGSVRYLAGLVHLFTGSSFFGTFLIFSFVSLFGLYFFYRAFETGLPNGDHKRYAYLIFLWPSLLFWPSSLGKEALVVSSLGLASWGVARILVHERGGLMLAAAGGAATMMVRPHVAIIVVVALIAALVMRPSEGDHVARLASKIVLLGVIVVGGAVLTTTAADFLGFESLGIDEVNEALSSTVGMTSTGGSVFAPARIATPLDVPWALVTVVFRPFPGEAGGLEGFLTGVEGLVLAGFIFSAIVRLIHLPRGTLRGAYLTYALVYVLVFSFAFSVIANFGILARQRSQVLPLVFVLLALPLAKTQIERRVLPMRRRDAIGGAPR